MLRSLASRQEQVHISNLPEFVKVGLRISIAEVEIIHVTHAECACPLKQATITNVSLRVEVGLSCCNPDDG